MSKSLLLVAWALLAQAAADLGERAEIELVVVRGGVPVEDATLFIDDENFGATDEQGALVARIPSGRRTLELRRGVETLLSIDLLTDRGELVLIIATINEDGEPDVMIESSGKDSALASESAGSVASESASDEIDDKPPGVLTGTVVSAGEGEPIARAQIFFSGITVEVTTGPEGRFSAELPAGMYSVSVVHPRFSSQTLENIRVIPEREVTLNIELTPAGIRLQEYVVTAPYVEGSIASVVEQQRAASGVSDVLGAAQISATGDNNAAEAVTRVTGLTVEDGKFVLIRGQPSRFTLALFNGSPLPSPEPLLQVVPLDLFPTGVLQGIVVQKGYTPDKPGSFGAGLVEIRTRAVPADPFLRLSMSTGWNSQSTFEDGLTYHGGSLDRLGFDDGTRALPDPIVEATEDGRRSLSVLPREQQNALAQEFPNILEQDERTLPPDFNLGISAGGKLGIWGDGTLGAIVTGGYRNQWRFQDRLQNANGLNAGVLSNQTELRELRTDNDVTLSGLLTLSAVWDDHELSSNTFVVNQTQQRTEFTFGLERTEDIRDVRRSLLSWIERSLVAQQLIGRHDFDWMVVEYRGLIARAARDAPDRRTYEFGKNQEQDEFLVQRGRGLTRSYSFVQDDQLAYGVDISFPWVWNDDSFVKPSFKVGLDRQEIQREAGEQRFLWNIAPTGDPFIDSPEVVFDPSKTGDGLELRDASILGADDYTGNSTISGIFAQADIKIGDLFRIVGGIRWEQADFLVESFQLSSQNPDIKPSGFEVGNYLPALLLTWFPTDDTQVRATYGRSLSRPILNELAPSFFFDPESGQQYEGNPDLKQTTIDGYDVRGEWYASGTESFTIGVFRKEYDQPLEQTFRAFGGGGIVATYQNAAGATVTGYEFGARSQLGRIRGLLGGPALLNNLYLSANVALLDSKVLLENTGIATSSERALQGQADIVVNAQAGYDGDDLNCTVSYNRVGERLQIVGVFENPNIIQDPLDTLDANISWEAFEDGTFVLQLSNLLNPSTRLTQQVDGQEELVFREFKRGRGVSFSFSYEFN